MRKSLTAKHTYHDSPVDLTSNNHLYMKKLKNTSYPSDLMCEASYESLKKQSSHQAMVNSALQNKSKLPYFISSLTADYYNDTLQKQETEERN